MKPYLSRRALLTSAVILCLLCALAFRLFHTVPAEAVPPFSVSFMVFNTQCDITVFDADRQAAAIACNDIIGRLTELHHAINAYDEASELSHLNRTAFSEPFACSPALWDIILKSEEAWTLSEGLFDVTVGPLLHLWGFHAKRDELPSEDSISSALRQVGFQHVRLDREAHTVRFLVPGMRMDFGGIAKGYALGLARTMAREHGLSAVLINLGGNLSRTDDAPAGRIVGIRNPRHPEDLAAAVRLHGQCIATSGNYERYRIIGGKRIGHIMDPRTGRPAVAGGRYESVTAVTTDPTFSDIFSTTAFVGGHDTAARLVKTCPGTAFIFISFKEDGSPSLTPIGDCELIQENAVLPPP